MSARLPHRVACSSCGRLVAVRWSGKLAAHNDAPFSGVRCPQSGIIAG